MANASFFFDNTNSTVLRKVREKFYTENSLYFVIQLFSYLIQFGEMRWKTVITAMCFGTLG